MSAQLLDGLALARQIRAELKERVSKMPVQPRIEAIVASQDPASLAYVGMKRKWAELCGMASGEWSAGPETTQDQLIAQIQKLNNDTAVHGVLVQHANFRAHEERLDRAKVRGLVARGHDNRFFESFLGGGR